LGIALDQCEFRQLALGDIEIVAENTNGLAGHFMIEGPSRGQDPSNLPVRAEDAEFNVEWHSATYGSVALGVDPLAVIGMAWIGKVRVALVSSGLEPKDGFELGRPRELARVEIAIP